MTPESLIYCIYSPKIPTNHLKNHHHPSSHIRQTQKNFLTAKFSQHVKPLHLILIFSLESEFPGVKPQWFVLAGQKTGRAASNIRSGFALVFILYVFR